MCLSQTIQPLSSLPLMFASCILSQVVTPQSESTLKTPTLNPFKTPTLNPYIFTLFHSRRARAAARCATLQLRWLLSCRRRVDEMIFPQ